MAVEIYTLSHACLIFNTIASVQLFCNFSFAEMASKNMQMYRGDDYVSASIKADYPHAKNFSVKFADDAFAVSADG